MKTTRIHVNQHNIKANDRTLDGDRLAMATVDADPGPYPLDKLAPVLTVKDYKNNRKGQTALLMRGNEVVAQVVYRPDKPLACGAKCWIETTLDVVVR